jgi:hypothetical protein
MGAMRDRDRALLSLFADGPRAARVRAVLSREQLGNDLSMTPPRRATDEWAPA